MYIHTTPYFSEEQFFMLKSWAINSGYPHIGRTYKVLIVNYIINN